MNQYLIVLVRLAKNNNRHHLGFINSVVRGDPYGDPFRSYEEAEEFGYKYVQEEFSRTGKQYSYEIVKIVHSNKE